MIPPKDINLGSMNRKLSLSIIFRSHFITTSNVFYPMQHLKHQISDMDFVLSTDWPNADNRSAKEPERTHKNKLSKSAVARANELYIEKGNLC